MKLKVLSSLAVVFLLSANVYAAGDKTCGGYSSDGNPFKCCDNNQNGKTSDSGDGNCVWWAWKMSKDTWKTAPPLTGGPSSWVSQAKAGKYTVDSKPDKNTIAVKNNHVAWVTDVIPRMKYDKKKKKNIDTGKKDIIVTEMNCIPGDKYASGKQTNTFQSELFQYIHKK